MKIRPIKPEHTTNCLYCKAEGNKVQAVWHLTSANKQACNKHLPELQQIKVMADSGVRDYLTEADYQTWLKL